MTVQKRSSAFGDTPVLEVEDLNVTFTVGEGTVEAVRGLSFSLARGETLAIVGESGSGKSVSAAAIMGVLPNGAQVSGRIIAAGTEVTAASERELLTLRASHAAMVFQDPVAALSPYYTVHQQLDDRLRIVAPQMNGVERAARSRELLELVRMPLIDDKLRAYPFELSGGQAQRVVIALALAADPQLLIADEPTTALDVTVQAEILDLLRRLSRELGAGLLLITHDMGVVADLADRVLVMRDGLEVECGAVGELFSHPIEPYTRDLLGSVPVLGSRTLPARDFDRVLLSIKDLEVSFARRRGKGRLLALDRVSLDLHVGETMGVVGESGSGKSTLGKAIMGFVPAQSGSIAFDGVNLVTGTRRQVREARQSIGVIYQNPGDSLDPRFTIFDSVAEPLRVVGSLSNAAIRSRVEELLERVGLPGDWGGAYPHEISGGQRQRVSIARALALRPRLVIADEPTSALDVSVQKRVLTLLRELQQDMGFACLFISHDLAVVEQVSDSVLVIEHGVVQERGGVLSVLRDPQAEYTRTLLGASPVPDPQAQATRRAARLRAIQE